MLKGYGWQYVCVNEEEDLYYSSNFFLFQGDGPSSWKNCRIWQPRDVASTARHLCRNGKGCWHSGHLELCTVGQEEEGCPPCVLGSCCSYSGLAIHSCDLPVLAALLCTFWDSSLACNTCLALILALYPKWCLQAKPGLTIIPTPGSQSNQYVLCPFLIQDPHIACFQITFKRFFLQYHFVFPWLKEDETSRCCIFAVLVAIFAII